jgi:hypothetical protein
MEIPLCMHAIQVHSAKKFGRQNSMPCRFFYPEGGLSGLRMSEMFKFSAIKSRQLWLSPQFFYA